MKRVLALLLTAALLAACESGPPPARTFTHTIVYGVVAGGEYTVTYTGPDFETVKVRPEGGQPWGLKFDVTLTEHREPFTAMLTVEPVDLLQKFPMQCRIDVDGEMVAAQDAESYRCGAVEIVPPDFVPRKSGS